MIGSISVVGYWAFNYTYPIVIVIVHAASAVAHEIATVTTGRHTHLSHTRHIRIPPRYIV